MRISDWSSDVCSSDLLVVLEIVVDQPLLDAVDRIDVAAAPRIEREHHPRRRRLQHVDEPRRPDIRRLHALHDGIAHEAGAERLTYRRSPAVAADQKAGADRPALAPFPTGHAPGGEQVGEYGES